MKAREWHELPASEQRQAMDLIRGEQAMWRSGKGTNWHPSSLAAVRLNYRVLAAAIRVLRSAARAKKKGGRR